MRILIATDGSEHSEAAAGFVTSLPLPPDCEFTLLTVVEPVRPLFAAEHPFIGRQVTEAFALFRTKLQQGAERLLERDRKRLQDAGLTVVHTAQREGHVADQITRACTELGADLLVVGSRGLGGFKGLMMGSISHLLLKHAPCSVLVVKSKEDRSPGGPRAERQTAAAGRADRLRILLAFDGSTDAQAAVRRLQSLPLGDRATIRVLSIVPELSPYGLDSAAVRLLAEVWEGEREAARQAAENAARQISSAVTPAAVEVREGDPARQILEVAREQNSDIIMLGARGKSAMERFLLGSASLHVACHAPCAVWVVRP